MLNLDNFTELLKENKYSSKDVTKALAKFAVEYGEQTGGIQIREYREFKDNFKRLSGNRKVL